MGYHGRGSHNGGRIFSEAEQAPHLILIQWLPGIEPGVRPVPATAVRARPQTARRNEVVLAYYHSGIAIFAPARINRPAGMRNRRARRAYAWKLTSIYTALPLFVYLNGKQRHPKVRVRKT